MKRKLILALFAAVLALGTSLCAEDSKGKGTEGASARFYTADDYEGADLELFNMLKETEWRPRAKGFFEHTSIINYASKKSQRLIFKTNGEVWYKFGASGQGVAGAFYINNGVIQIETMRLVYKEETDQLEDVISGRIFDRVGEKPAAKADSTDASVKQEE